MSKNDKNELSFLGIKINNNITPILFFLALIGFINQFAEIYIWRGFINQLPLFTFEELLEFIGVVLVYWIRLLVPLTMSIIFLYIIFNCLLAQKSFRETEDFKTKWLGFRLTQTSLPLLLILSILNLIISFSILYYNLATFIDILLRRIPYPEFLMTSYVITIVITPILIIIYIYTLIICLKNRKNYR